MSKTPLGLTADKLRNFPRESLKSPAEIDSLTPVTSLFQTGYLTIDKIIRDNRNVYYTLNTPNEEVKPAFFKEFSDCLYNLIGINKHDQQTNFIDAIIAEDSDKLSILIDSFFGAIPASLHIEKEAYYHSVFYGYLEGLADLIAFPEKPGADGTPDIICVIDNDLYVIVELKYQIKPESNPADIDQLAETTMRRLAIFALETIDAKKYLRPYLAKAKKILRLGLGVCGRGRTVAILDTEERATARVKSKKLRDIE
jgi:hypothetical protein